MSGHANGVCRVEDSKLDGWSGLRTVKALAHAHAADSSEVPHQGLAWWVILTTSLISLTHGRERGDICYQPHHADEGRPARSRGASMSQLSTFSLFCTVALTMKDIRLALDSLALLYWALGCSALVLTISLTALIPASRSRLGTFMTWGKLRGAPSSSVAPSMTTSSQAWVMKVIDICVPKRWFLHFYVIGLSFNCIVLYCILPPSSFFLLPSSSISPISSTPQSNGNDDQQLCVVNLSSLILLGLMVLQTLRRTIECLFISKFTDGSMHVIHYLVGVSFYIVVALSIVKPSIVLKAGCGLIFKAEDNSQIATTAIINDDVTTPAIYLLIIVYFYVSWIQFQSHFILASLRDSSNPTLAARYAVPTGGWFDWVSSPHYLAEIVIYSLFAIISGPHNMEMWMALAFVLLNQSFAAWQVS